MPDCVVIGSIYDESTGMSQFLNGEETPLTGCPAGDFGFTLNCEIDFDDADMNGIDVVNPEEIIFISEDLPFTFWDAGTEGTPGTSANGYTVTAVRKFISGCSQCEGFEPPQTAPKAAVLPLHHRPALRGKFSLSGNSILL